MHRHEAPQYTRRAEDGPEQSERQACRPQASRPFWQEDVPEHSMEHEA